MGADGNFYGVAGARGANGTGTVFQITPTGTFTTLHSFEADPHFEGISRDGIYPYGTLVQGNDGNFYGVTDSGGSYGQGTVFRITPAGVVTIVHSFGSVPGVSPRGNADGGFPNGLTRADDGNFYGLTFEGGTGGRGTAFRLTPGGVLTTLHSFGATGDNGINLDGADPVQTLLQGSDGNFYGVTSEGGTGGGGTIFQLTPAGVLTTLQNFDTTGFDFPNAAGSGPNSLVQAADGSFYGTTTGGGTDGVGTVFRLSVALSPPSPVITSAAADTAPLGQAYTYQITATDHSTTYFATGLPPGLSLDSGTGLISGTPTTEGTFGVILSASDGSHVGAQALSLITVAPVVTLTATVPQVTAGTGAVGVFTLNLSAAQDHDVTVHFAIKGSAMNGTDYDLIKATRTIRAGETSKSIKIIPSTKGLASGETRVAALVLTPGDGYAVGTTGKVKVKMIGQ